MLVGQLEAQPVEVFKAALAATLLLVDQLEVRPMQVLALMATVQPATTAQLRYASSSLDAFASLSSQFL